MVSNFKSISSQKHSSKVIASIAVGLLLAIQSKAADPAKNSLPVGQDYDVGNTPPYVLEANLHGVSEEQAYSVLNIREFGAVGDGASHPLSNKYKSQAEIDKRYGANRYLLDDEFDYVGLCEAIRYAKYYKYKGKPNSKIWPTEPRGHCVANAIYAPSGEYIINRTVKIQDFWGFSISGAGRGGMTTFYFTGTGSLFWVQYAGTGQFKDFCMSGGKVEDKRTGFYVVNDDIKDENQKKGRQTTFNIRYDNIIMINFYKAVDIVGTAMGDNEYFYSCRFAHNFISIHLRNPQSMSLEFYSCSWWGPEGKENTGKATAFLVEAGGQINVFGGEFIRMGSTLKLMPNRVFNKGCGGGATISAGTGSFNFWGVRWEMDKLEPLLFDAVDDGSLFARINIENCVVWQCGVFEKRQSLLGVLRNGMNVTIRNLNTGPKHYKAKIIGATGDYDEKRKGVLILDNIVGPLAYAEADLDMVKSGEMWDSIGGSFITDENEWKHLVELRVPGRKASAINSTKSETAAPAQETVKPEIIITESSVTYPNDNAFTITLRAKSRGVSFGGYLFRSKTTWDGAPLNGMKIKDRYLFPSEADLPDYATDYDNGRYDENKMSGIYSRTFSVTGWHDGEYKFLIAAHNRPAAGEYVSATVVLRVVITGGKIDAGKTIIEK